MRVENGGVEHKPCELGCSWNTCFRGPRGQKIPGKGLMSVARAVLIAVSTYGVKVHQKGLSGGTDRNRPLPVGSTLLGS